MALLAGEQPGSRAVLVVLDGVSNLVDSDVASLAGARAAREVLRTPLPAGMGTPQSKEAAVAKVFTDAAAAANTAIIAVTDPDEPNPASATFTVAVLEGTRISHANIGDSRCYWLPDEGEPVQLTVDDSVAQTQIASGVAKEVAETGEFAHAITKWLGRDSEDFVPVVGGLDVTGPGWLLACSDGLWNYASEPNAIRARSRQRRRPTRRGSRSSWWRSPMPRAATTTSPPRWRGWARWRRLRRPRRPARRGRRAGRTRRRACCARRTAATAAGAECRYAGTNRTAPTTDAAGEGAPTDG